MGCLHLVQRGGDWAGCGPLHIIRCGTVITSVVRQRVKLDRSVENVQSYVDLNHKRSTEGHGSRSHQREMHAKVIQGYEVL